MSNGVFNRGYYFIANKDIDAMSFRLMLVSTQFTYNQDLKTVDDGTTSDPASYEISVGGYSRQTPGSVTSFTDDTNDFVGIDAADVTFSALTAGATIGGAVLYCYATSGNSTGGAQTTSDTGQDLIAFFDVVDTPTNGGDITIQWASTSAGGMLRISSTS